MLVSLYLVGSVTAAGVTNNGIVGRGSSFILSLSIVIGQTKLHVLLFFCYLFLSPFKLKQKGTCCSLPAGMDRRIAAFIDFLTKTAFHSGYFALFFLETWLQTGIITEMLAYSGFMLSVKLSIRPSLCYHFIFFRLTGFLLWTSLFGWGI